ncbi:DUF3990 domain-containing protein [Sporosarcina sp. FSL W8-0480]|uniref:DUF3990 domain-containing protein n=1 Tax=Sporosarcina sp. FSL W8-0480 TaxID=2954701 RepID=UPI0030D9B7D7
MLINYDPNLPLYHGTIDLYSDSVLKHGVKIFPRKKGGVDFGPGFYLTSNFEQAENWAKRRTEKPIPIKSILELSSITIGDFLGMKKDFQPTVLKFRIKDAAEWEELNYKVFGAEDSVWREFVWNMRQGNQDPLKSKDWIYGPVADGGLLSTNFKDIKAYHNKNQLAVLTDEAAQHLELLEVVKC